MLKQCVDTKNVHMKMAYTFIAVFTAFILLTSCAPAANQDPLPDGFVYISDVIPSAFLEIRYFSDDNFVGAVIDGYEAPKAILTEEAAEALRQAADALFEQGYYIKIFDAYRPQRAVDHFVRWSKDIEDTKMKEKILSGSG